MLKEIPSDKIKGTKNVLFFFNELQLITVLPLIRNSYTSWSTRSISLKLLARFSIFNSVSFLLKFVLFNKKHWLFQTKNGIIPFKLKVIQKPYKVLLPDLWFLSCSNKLKKFNDVSWSSHKTDLEMNFLNLENQSFK